MMKKDKKGKRGKDRLDQFLSECEMTKLKLFQSLHDQGFVCPMLGKVMIASFPGWNYSKNQEDAHIESNLPIEASLEQRERHLKREEENSMLRKENLALREEVVKLKREVVEAHYIREMREL
ncbi:uncharacterized protein G2W53_037332 [Senna tora]|uniref:Uncharacterized protein n=1 Tax=Senna tora TaxID=362788 RepID=A0A834WB03_9FABA|nr:uncharacterized protein G2W53_037330 [Senna tora]KAF7810589.1 uncharacterized protein G2W53_037332 [Senna tora]